MVYLRKTSHICQIWLELRLVFVLFIDYLPLELKWIRSRWWKRRSQTRRERGHHSNHHFETTTKKKEAVISYSLVDQKLIVSSKWRAPLFFHHYQTTRQRESFQRTNLYLAMTVTDMKGFLSLCLDLWCWQGSLAMLWLSWQYVESRVWEHHATYLS